MRANLYRGRIASLRLPVLVPGPLASFLIIVACALIGSGLGLMSPSAAIPTTPSLGLAAPPPLPAPRQSVVRSGGLMLEDLLPLSRDFELLQAGEAGQPAVAWPDQTGLLSRFRAEGALSGSQSLFRRPGPSADAAPLQVQSAVAQFRESSRAGSALQQLRNTTPRAGAASIALELPGESGVAYQVTQGPFVTYYLGFSKGANVATLAVTSFADQDARSIVTTLAARLSDRLP